MEPKRLTEEKQETETWNEFFITTLKNTNECLSYYKFIVEEVSEDSHSNTKELNEGEVSIEPWKRALQEMFYEVMHGLADSK